MNKFKLKKIIQQNNLTIEQFQAALDEINGERMLFDRIRGHFNGSCDGKYKDVPDSIIHQLIHNLNTKDIINWDKVMENSIYLTQVLETDK